MCAFYNLCATTQENCMNIKEELFAEHSKQQAVSVAKYACELKDNMQQLVDCLLSTDTIIAQRAAWSIGWSVKINPTSLIPFIHFLIPLIERKDVHDAVIRNTMLVLEAIDIPEEYHGLVMNGCFNLIENPSTAPAIKAYSMTTVYNLSKYYPEILQELKTIIENNWDNETPAFKSRGKKILKSIKKIRK